MGWEYRQVAVARRFLLPVVLVVRMDDVVLLRQTVRRCTGVIVATLAIAGVSLQHPSEAGLLLMIAVGSVLYLVTDVFQLIPATESTDDDPVNTPSTDESSKDL